MEDFVTQNDKDNYDQSFAKEVEKLMDKKWATRESNRVLTTSSLRKVHEGNVKEQRAPTHRDRHGTVIGGEMKDWKADAFSPEGTQLSYTKLVSVIDDRHLRKVDENGKKQ